jgi:hypothetical protein
VLLLAAIIPFSFHIVSCGDLQESSPLLLLTFLLGLWTIREDRKILMATVFLISGINSETMLIFPLVYLHYNYEATVTASTLFLHRSRTEELNSCHVDYYQCNTVSGCRSTGRMPTLLPLFLLRDTIDGFRVDPQSIPAPPGTDFRCH